LTVAAITVGGAPGGNYVEADVATYVSIGHFPEVILSGYLAVFAILGLICLLAYLRELISAEPGRRLAASIFWGIGLFDVWLIRRGPKTGAPLARLPS